MDSPLSTLGFVIFGITFSIYSVIAECQSPSTSASRPPHPPWPMPPPHLSPPPLPPHLSLDPFPLYALPPSRPPSSPPPKSLHHQHHPAPHNLAPMPKTSPANPTRSHHRSPPRLTSHRMNGGKKIGLLFAGVAGIMQIGVVGFLVFKRRQLLRTKDAFEVGA